MVYSFFHTYVSNLILFRFYWGMLPPNSYCFRDIWEFHIYHITYLKGNIQRKQNVATGASTVAIETRRVAKVAVTIDET